MKEYIAKMQDGKYGIYVNSIKQMEKHLKAGENIYEIENGKHILIATPKDGFLGERPALSVVKNIKLEISNEPV